MMDPFDHQPTLILNHTMKPHRVVGWQDAITLLYSKKIEVLDNYEEMVCSPSTSIPLPAVARLCRKVSLSKTDVKFSRYNIFLRDRFACQYCGDRLSLKRLNYDHVIPKSAGGKTSWENIVTSCYPCNSRKGNHRLEDIGMKLLRKPIKPRYLPLTTPMILAGRVPIQWVPYLSEEDIHLVSEP